MNYVNFRASAALALIATAMPLPAGTYSQDFNGFGDGITNLNDGSFIGANEPGPAGVRGLRLRLTENGNGDTLALYRLPDLDPGSKVTAFDVQFDLALNGGGGTPGDGLSLCFGALPLTDTAGPGEEGYQLPGGMVISFDTSINGAAEIARTLEVRIDGIPLVSVNESAFGGYLFNNSRVSVSVHWDAVGLDVIFGGSTVCDNLSVPGLVPAAGDRFAWSARTGSETSEDVFLDNVVVSTAPLSPIIRPNLALSEMVVDNTRWLDEHFQTPGWVELYNGTASPVSLDGWSLTNDAGIPAKWPFPAGQTIPSYGYVVVWLGHGTPAPGAPDTLLHANFTLSKTGGYLGLYQGATEIDSFTAYGQQFEDAGYGHLGHAWTLGFLEFPSPGTMNDGLQEPSGPVAEEVVWSRDGGLITGPTNVTMNAPVIPGGEIRYTLDNSRPSRSSILYDHTTPVPITVSASTNVRARIFAPGVFGPVTSRTFLKLDSSLTNYRGTGQPFSSSLPIIVIDSFGRSLDAENSTAPGARPFRYTYNVVLDRDPANGSRAHLTGTAPVDFQGRSGMHVRGESASTMLQRQYAWETRDNEENDKNVSILGFPNDSDWILYAPGTDKTLLRNYIAYSTMYDTRGESSAMRVKFVEVFFNQPALGGISTDTSPDITWRDYRGVYVLVEKIKRGNDRVDIARLDQGDTSPTLISGGYLFKKDKASPDPDLPTSNQNFEVVEPRVTPGDPQWTWLRDHLNAFESSLYGAGYADPETGYRAYIDEQSFMDNQWWVEILKQIDGYRLSSYFYKDRGQKIKAGPLWDYDLSGGNAEYFGGWDYRGWHYNNAGISQSGFDNDYHYYGRLRQDPGYILRHWDRYWQLRESTFATASLMGRIDAAIAELTGNQPAIDIKNSAAWDITNHAAAANTAQLWPESTPCVEVPAARHAARWQRLGIYDWPNAPGRDQRDYYVSATDAADFTNFSASGYNVDAPPAMSETVHLKSFLKLRIDWMDDAFILSNVILRPPLFSHPGGDVTAPHTLTISAFTGAPPSNALYAPEATDALRYGAGDIYYTTDGTDPIRAAGSVRNWVTDTNACAATVPQSADADADSAGRNWKDPDFNPFSPPAGVTWYSGLNGVGYDDTRAPGSVNLMPHINIAWSTASFPVPDRPAMKSAGSLPNDGPGNQTCYIRLPFTLSAADIAGINRLRLQARYDDGFIAYLNGVQIASKNPPPGAPHWFSGASQSVNDANAISYAEIPVTNTAAALAVLRAGTNVLAVHGLNAGVGSSDFLQRFKLDGEISTAQAVTGPVTITSPVTVKARLLDTVTANWSPLAEGTFVVGSVPASAANLVVSEIMYHPTDPTAAEIAAGFTNDNMFEYLEVMNTGPNTIDLSGVSITTGFTFAWPANNPNLRLLAPGERAVMVGHAGAFAMRYAPGPGVKSAGVFDGNLGDGGEHLVITGTAGTIKDFKYDDDAPWPPEADGEGYSLVLNHPASNPNHNLPQSWRCSLEVNGTPGTPAGSGGPTGSAAEALADTDGDGVSDLLEFATGTLGVSGAPQHWPVTGTTSLIVPPALTPSDYLTFEYIRSRSADGFTFEPEISTALTGWQALSSLFIMASQTNNSDGTATIRWRSIHPAASLPPRLFLHVRAEIDP